MTTPDPTSPSGMSKPAIKRDLLDNHGWSHEQVRNLLTKAACEQALVQARLDSGNGLSPERKAEREQAKMDAYEQRREAEQAQAEVDADDDTEDEDDPFADSDLDDIEVDEPAPKPVAVQPEPSIEEVALTAEQMFDVLDGMLDQDADLDDPEALLADIASQQPQSLFLGMPETLDYRFDGHAGAGPSGAERWMNCTASLGAVREFLETLTPNQQAQYASAGTAARQGTVAHAAGEAEVNLLLGKITAEEHENTLLSLTIEPDVEEAYSDEMAEYLTEYTDYVATLIDAGHEVVAERRVEAMIPLSVTGAYTHRWPADPDDPDGEVAEAPDWYCITGSADLTALPTATDNVLTVGDLKYGEGLDVDVASNPQIRIYALGVLSTLADDEGNLPELDRIDYAIVQPRLGGLKVWTESLEDLITWRDEVLSPALTSALGLDGNAVFAPSDLACQWCPVRGSCPALTEQRLTAGADLFDAIVEAEYEGTTVQAEALSNDRLAALLSQVEGLLDLKDDLKAEAQRRMYRGEQMPGYQLVNYTPPRFWKDGADAAPGVDKLPIWKPQALLTPKQALAVLGEEAAKVESLIETPDKRPVIAKIGGKNRAKPWVGKAPEDMFSAESTD